MSSRERERLPSPGLGIRKAGGQRQAQDVPALVTNLGETPWKSGIGEQAPPDTHLQRNLKEYVSRSIKQMLPWTNYDKGFEIKYDIFVTVAARKAPESGKVATREYTNHGARNKIEMLHRVRNINFVELLKVYSFDGTYFAVFEHVLISLAQVVQCIPYPSELQLAVVLAHVKPTTCTSASVLTSPDP